MKLLTFGCSYTNYYWPTWSDLLGHQFDDYQNWAISGLGNNAIMQRLNEAVTSNTLNKDDVVVVQFTDLNRIDMHSIGILPFGNWRAGGNIWMKPSEEPWIRDTWNEDSYAYMNHNYISMTMNFLKNLPCKWAVTSSVDLPQILADKEFVHNKNIYSNWIKPIQLHADESNSPVVNVKYKDADSISLFTKKQKIDQDRHPSINTYARWVKKYLAPKLDLDIKDNEFLNHYLTNDEIDVNMIDKTNLYYTKFKWAGKYQYFGY
jgi:hypothetical protein